MLSDEEKEAIEYLKQNDIAEIQYDNYGLESIHRVGIDEKQIILNLIEKQSKEIEELKREKETNQQMIQLAETQILGYGQGYKDGLNKETTNIRKYFTRSYNRDKEISYSWYNTEYFSITKKGIEQLKDYIVKRSYIREIIVVNNVEVTRPQRTWGDMPEWFRPASAFHCFDSQNHENSFVMIIYDKCYQEEEIQEAFKSFPKTAQVIFIKR